MIHPLNTPENKARFLAQYWGQKVLKNVLWNESIPSVKISYGYLIESEIPNLILEIIPLSNITDDHCLKLTSLSGRSENLFGGSREGYIGRDFISHLITQGSRYTDFLRGNGYALDWTDPEGNTITVEMQIEFGWIKLKDID